MNKLRMNIRKIIKEALLLEIVITGTLNDKEYTLDVSADSGLIKIENKKFKITGKSLLTPEIDINIIDIFEVKDKIMIKFSTVIKEGEMELSNNVKNKIAENYLQGNDIFEISGYLGTFTFMRKE